MRDRPGLLSMVCTTGQHRTMINHAMQAFGIRPDFDLAVMRPGQTLGDLTAAILNGLPPLLKDCRPDLVLVHGDTTTTLSAALAAFYGRIPLGHVEAGLRTGNLQRPWPEEMNRRVVDSFADYLFAPTPKARENLLAEGLSDRRITVTGNTGIDALLDAVRILEEDPVAAAHARAVLPPLDPAKRLILVTGHRRESFGEGMEAICRSLARLSRRSDIEILYPVHLNPNVRDPVMRILSGFPNVHLVEPLDYLPFIEAMRQSHLVLTDSGGVQEEAPSLGKPILVMRELTERPEAVEAGTARLVGISEERICDVVSELLDDPDLYQRMARVHNPYGDGRASDRIIGVLLHE